MIAIGSKPGIPITVSDRDDLLGPRTIPAGTDKGAARDSRPTKPCCKQFEPTRFCWLDDAHAGPCDGAPKREHPAGEYKPPAGAAPGSWSSGKRRVF